MIKRAQNEFIFAIAFDGIRTNFWRNNFLTHQLEEEEIAEFGINGGWGGLRTTSAFVDKFDANTTDTRGQFYKMGKTKEIKDIGTLQDMPKI
jgi:hypothetical protein